MTELVEWVRLGESFELPENAIHDACHDQNGNLYVARGYYEDDVIPGKYSHNLKECYVARNGKELKVSDFEVLTLNTHDGYFTSWIEVGPTDRIPLDALKAGEETSNRNTLFVARSHVFGGLHIGKVPFTPSKCFISYKGKEHAIDDFEVLVISKIKYIKKLQEDKEIESNKYY